MKRIVVGVDGSEASMAALRWAVDEADLHGASLQVVYAYEHVMPWTTYASDEGMTARQIEAMRHDLQHAADEAAARAQALVDAQVAQLDTSVPLEAVAVQAHHPAEVLNERSKEADLLVVGSRGRGGFAGLLLGSVSQQCASHASCPVTIIRA